jgi:hypothetical protein
MGLMLEGHDAYDPSDMTAVLNLPIPCRDQTTRTILDHIPRKRSLER